jgi:arginyl-tRNA synthetase
MTAHTTQHYPLEPVRDFLGRQLHQALTQLLPQGATLAYDTTALGRLLEKPPERDFGDYSLPCFRFAKDLRLKPQEIAVKLQGIVESSEWVSKVDVVGAFLNIFVRLERLALSCIPQILDGSYFERVRKPLASLSMPVQGSVPGQEAEKPRWEQKVMIEYSQPNTLKEFHIGHTRNVCLGDALVRLFRYCGYQVTGANYYGDDGTHIALVLWHMKKKSLVVPGVSQDEWFGQVYAQARKAYDEASESDKKLLQQEISEIHRQVEKKQGDYYQLWLTTREVSLRCWLGVSFDVEFFESEVTEEAQEIVDEFYKKGVFVLDQGAIGADLKNFKLGFCILRKSDGNTLYATKDLALARRKFEDYQIDRSIYVVADEQNYHFKQVFKTLSLMGFKQADRCFHLSYGLVMLPEGKMSSRAGTAVTLPVLRRQMEDALGQILAKYEGQWTEEELQDVKTRLCLGAIKYGMIATDPVKEIIFNLEDWLSFEGHSGPYLMYSYTRTQSILRKAESEGYQTGQDFDFSLLKESSERDLVRELHDFNDAVIHGCESYKPSVLAQHLYGLCKCFNRFYSDVSVLKAETSELRQVRLGLIRALGMVLHKGLELLGVEPPTRM